MSIIAGQDKKSTSLWESLFVSLVIVLLPFSLEFIFWNLADQYAFVEILEYGLSCGSALVLFAIALIFFRSPLRAALAVFILTTLFIIIVPLNDTLSLAIGNERQSQKIFRWGICFLFAASFAYGAYRLICLIKRKKRAALAALFFLVLAGIGIFLRPSLSFQKTSPGSDVIIIVMDTARADHLSIYGYPRPTTPGLEWLSQKAAVYEKAMSPSQWTPSAHASLFTGLLPAEHGTDGEFLVFRPPAPSLPEIMRRSGFRTAAIVNNPFLATSYGWDRGFEDYVESWNPRIALARRIWHYKTRNKDWIWHGNTKRTIKIARYWWAINRKHPRLLFLNLIDPHSPYGDPHQFKDIYLDDETRNAPDLSNDEEDYDAGLVRANGIPLKRIIARYDGDIHYMDFCLHSFFRWLERRKELDSTLTILTSDHGERLGERERLGHTLGLDQATLHVPLLIRFPGRVPSGRFSNIVQIHGIFQSVLKLTGIQITADRFQRVQALDEQHGSIAVAQMRDQRIYLEGLKKRNPAFNPSPYLGDWNSAFDGTWKLCLSNSGQIEFFHLPDDPAEEKNLIKDFPKEAKRLISFIAELPEFGRGEKANNIPQKIQEMLKSLGYAGR